MQLTNIALVNWHWYPVTDIKICGQIIGLTGENGAGKSTILDAIQAVITGGNESLCSFNKSADPGSTKRSPHARSIKSYALGAYGDDGNFKRDECFSYVMLGFTDPTGKLPPVTIGLAIEARKQDGKAHKKGRFVARGVLLKAADITLDHESGGRIALPWNEVRDIATNAARQGGGTFVDHGDTSWDKFVKEYQQALFARGIEAAPDPKSYVRNLINATAFTGGKKDGISSINEFYRNNILEKNDIDITTFKDQIRNYRKVQSDIKKVKDQIEILSKAIESADELKKIDETIERETAFALYAETINALAHHAEVSRKLKAATKEGERLNEQLSDIEGRLGEANEELGAARERRGAIASVSAGQLISGQIDIIKEKRERLSSVISGEKGLIVNLKSLIGSVRSNPAVGDEELRNCVLDMEAITRNTDGEGIPSDVDEADDIIAPLIDRMSDFRDQLEKATFKRKQSEEDISNRIESLKNRMANGQGGHATYSPPTLKLLDFLKVEGIEARVLCDLVEVTDPRWGDAAEVSLGSFREALIVDRSRLNDAYRIYHSNRRKIGPARLANLRKLENRGPAKPGTMAEILHSDDDDVNAYIRYRVGNLNLATDGSDLDKPGRWITQDCMQNDGLDTTYLEVRDRKLGKSARARDAEQAHQELIKLVPAHDEAKKSVRACKEVEERFRVVCETVNLLDGDRPFTSIREQLDEKDDEIDRKRHELESLDTGETDAIDDEIGILKSEADALDKEKKEIENQINTLTAEITNSRRELENGTNGTGLWKTFRNKIEECSKPVNRAVMARKKEEYHSLLNDQRGDRKPSRYDHRRIAESCRNKAKEEANGRGDAEMEAFADAKAALSALEEDNLFPTKFRIVKDFLPYAIEERDELKNEVIVGYEAECREWGEKIEETFKQKFLSDLKTSFDSVSESCRVMNHVLKAYAPLGERYSFQYKPAPELKHFHDLIVSADDIVSDFGLFAAANTVSDHTRAKIEGVINEILEATNPAYYEDYRNYWNFDLKITKVADGSSVMWSSRAYSASGGEKQVPFYISFLCALAAMYYGGSKSRLKKGQDGMGLIIFDEAFSNMEEKAKGEVIKFARDMGLQLVLCGPDGSRVSVEKHADCMIDVIKVPGYRSATEVDYLKDRARAELIEIEPKKEDFIPSDQHEFKEAS